MVKSLVDYIATLPRCSFALGAISEVPFRMEPNARCQDIKPYRPPARYPMHLHCRKRSFKRHLHDIKTAKAGGSKCRVAIRLLLLITGLLKILLRLHGLLSILLHFNCRRSPSRAVIGSTNLLAFLRQSGLKLWEEADESVELLNRKGNALSRGHLSATYHSAL